MSFQNKKIVITGASPNFGQTLSILFAKLGAELFLSARTLEKADSTAKLVKQVVPKTRISTCQADVSRPEDIRQFAETVKKTTPNIDILINNASLWLGATLFEASSSEIAETINSTATGSILVTKHFLPLLEKSTCPDIVFINSTASLMHHSDLIINEAFSAGKAAQSVFADRLRLQMKSRNTRVITIYPPHFDNPSPLVEEEWNVNRSQPEFSRLAARNVFECIKFALSQDRICAIDKIILSNNAPEISYQQTSML